MTLLLTWLGIPIELIANLVVLLVTGLQDQLTGSVKNVYNVAVVERDRKREKLLIQTSYRAHISNKGGKYAQAA